MSSIINDYSQTDNSIKYESIYRHYGLIEYDDENTFSTINNIIERNDNNKEKKINGKTVRKTTTKHISRKQLKHDQNHQSKLKHKNHDKVIKIPVPPSAKTRKASYTSSTTATNQVHHKPISSTPAVELHAASDSTIKTSQKLPSYHSQTSHSVSNTQMNPNQLQPPHIRSHRLDTNQSVSTIPKSSYEHEPLLDLNEINKFTRDIFKFKHGHRPETENHPYRPRLICPQDENLEAYIKSRFKCIDIFDEYVNLLKKQHGVVRDAANDPATFDPGITIIGPQVKKDPELIDKEDSQVIKKIIRMEPRKKYALVHEDVGIFIIGGYNLFVDVPVQKEPETDYLFKSNGSVIKIPALRPSRCNFAVYADGQAIYVAGGQTIHNELLDDIQRLNINTLKWEPVATLLNPIAASGMTIENDRIYLVGGYDIILNQTTFLEDFIIYNLLTQQFEKATDLPSPRCRSLVFATDNAIYCVSGLIQSPSDNKNKKIKISTDILKWSHETPQWIKVSQTPELTKFHALSFNDPYLEITKRSLDDADDAGDFLTEAYFDFQTNIWVNGKPPEHRPNKSTVQPSSPNMKQIPTKHKSPLNSKQKKTTSKNKTNRKKTK